MTMMPRLEHIFQDLRAGARVTKTAPGLTVTAVLLIALAIGGNASVYSMRAGTFVVGPDYVRAFGRDMIRGRALNAGDRSRGSAVAVINEHLAATLWPGQLPLGRTMLVGTSERLVEIVGVMPNAFFAGYSPERPELRPRYILLPEQPGLRVGYDQDPAAPGETTFYLRFTGDLAGIGAAVPSACARSIRRCRSCTCAR
jgi:hypothetical protein